MEGTVDDNEQKGASQEKNDSAEVSIKDRQRLLEKIKSRVSSAPIKEEFIDFRRFNELYGDQSSHQTIKTSDEGSSEPPRKRQKKSGQNKSRPRPTRTRPNERLCLNVSMGKVCEYGDKCKFNHNIADMMEKKLPDIGPKCYNFDMFGHCPFGLMCRYGASHITLDFKNIIDESRKVDSQTLTSNQLTVQLKQALRKRKVDCPRSDAYLRTLPMKGKGKMREARDNSILLATKESNCPKSKPSTDDILTVKSSGPQDHTTEGDLAPVNCSESSNASISQSGSTWSHEPQTKTTKDKSVSSNKESSPQTKDNSIVVSEILTSASERENENSLSSIHHFSDKNTLPEDIKGSISVNEDTKQTPLEDLPQQKDPVVDRARDSKIAGPLGGCSVDGPREEKSLDVKGKLLLAPLTTVGNLPFRRICKRFGADITCGEMAMCTNLLQGQACEWALLRRHHTEDVFGAQLCGAFPDTMTKCAELLSSKLELDFIDVNVGCPIDMVYHKGAGSGLMNRMSKFEQIVRGMSSVMDIPLTVKLRTGVMENKNTAHTIIPKLYDWGASVVTVHGRSREARYTRSADWDYLKTCSKVAYPHPFIGNGDILSFEEANDHFSNSGSTGLMIARGALIKPWIFTEIKEQRHWDISSGERFDILRDFSNYGLEHWGSDSQGVEKTRRFLLEWLSFLHRYIPVSLLERLPQRINERPPYYVGRNDLETLMASANCGDWVKISEMLLGPVPDDFNFLPKHKANSYK